MIRILKWVSIVLISIIFIPVNGIASIDSTIVNNKGFYEHLIKNGEYDILFKLTAEGLKKDKPSKALIYYHTLAAFKLEKYNEIIASSDYWQLYDTTEYHFKYLILESIAAIKFKKDSITNSNLNKLSYFPNYKNRNEILFLLNVYDTVVRQMKSLSNASISHIQNITILTPEDSKDVIKSINGIEFPKHKSVVLAGLMSAIIPGSGKWYAGYFGTPFASLFLNAILGGVSLEIALKQGWVSWPALASYAVFSTFYVGNIVGTIYSVKIKKNENEAFYKGVMLYHLMSAFERYNAS